MEQLEQLVGSTLDQRYRLLDVRGTGGSAVVFRAQDLLLRRTVALKLLRSKAVWPQGRGGNASPSPPDRVTEVARDAEMGRISREAFLREALAASHLSHPNVVSVYDVSPSPIHPYIVMEYIEGVPLSSRIAEQGALSHEEVLRVAEAVLDALTEAHAQGIIHRDIKAQNILITEKGDIKIADFGIAHVPGQRGRILQNKILATVDTVSPEGARGGAVDERSDLYSLGVVLYQMATGRLPFVDDDPETVAFLHIHEPPRYPSILQPDIPRGLEQLILVAMEKDPDRRPQSAAAMLSAVRRLRRDPHRSLPRLRRVTFFDLVRRVGGSGASLAVVLGMLAALVTGSTLFPVLNGSMAHPVTVVSVTDVIGLSATEAEARLAALDPRIRVAFVYTYAPNTEEGAVLAVLPDPGTYLKLDGEDDCITVTLTVSTHDTAASEHAANTRTGT